MKRSRYGYIKSLRHFVDDDRTSKRFKVSNWETTYSRYITNDLLKLTFSYMMAFRDWIAITLTCKNWKEIAYETFDITREQTYTRFFYTINENRPIALKRLLLYSGVELSFDNQRILRF